MQDYVTKGLFEMKEKPIKMGIDPITQEPRPDKLVYVPFLTQKGLKRMGEWLKERDFLTEENAKAYIKKVYAERKHKRESVNQ
jgi:hypothetical protein